MMLPLFADPAAPVSPSAKATTLFSVAQLIEDRLGNGCSISRQTLKALMRKAFGASDAWGEWSMRDAYEALEMAQVRLALRADQTLIQPGDPVAAFAARQLLARRLPTQSYRSERQVDLQQFSTPLELAWLVACAARIRSSDLVLEPSAGTGMLAVHARHVGAALLLNERDALRADLLAQLFDQPVLREDGEFIDDHLDMEARPSLILINPPFARSEMRGRDRHAGARHLRSALCRLAPGGRCVALMSPAFARGGTDAKGYASVAETVPPRWELTIEGRPYAKHGTSISIRLLIFDKGWTGPADVRHADSLEAALPITLAAPARLEPDDGLTPAPVAMPRPAPLPVLTAGRGGSLLAGAARPRRLAPPPPPADRSAVSQLSYDRLDTPPPAGEQIGVYLPWRLTRMAIPSAKPHPNILVESTAMASVFPPMASHRPLLSERAFEALSDAQVETLIFAGQAFERDVPGRYTPNKDGTLLDPDANGAAYRMGFFIGDGTGVGKGQQIAGCILDRWNRGSRRAVWISKSAALIEDARRDWSALGGLPIDIQPLDAFPFGTDISMDSGIVFLTYATLRSSRHDSASRLQQILAWLSPDFDGVIAFDEAHEMSNAAGTETMFGNQKGSEQGLAGVRLQNLRPRACILYASATGATDPANLCYASRLGLWGVGTAFDTRDAFMAAIAEGGIAAMEIVARDLKALGVYTARALTFAGVEYQAHEHVLTPDQITTYNVYADAWAIIHAQLDAVLEATNIVDRISKRTLNAMAKGSALSRFESAKQRFFSQVLIAMKMETLIPEIEREIGDGNHVVVQLVTTSEAMLERRLAGLSADERAALDIELSPTEYMIDYLRTAFPTNMMRVFRGADEAPRSELMLDEDGNPVDCQEALRVREALIEQLCSMPPIGAALDEMIRHFGTERIAEVTGRSRRLVVDGQGRQKVDRRGSRANVSEADAFMSGAKSVLVFSDAGGTGRSYHADRGCGSAGRRRVHFLLEPGWRASAAIQGLGRTNRTNQMSAPVFRPVTTDCRGERRFISTIARRLDSLGALTRGQWQTGGQNLFDPADNLESDYAKEALLQWYRLLSRGKLASTKLADFIAMTGLKLIDSETGMLLDRLPPIQRFLNRLLALRIEVQNAIFDEYLGLIQARIDEARAAGTLDVGVETFAAERITLLQEQVLRRDPVTGAETRLCRLELQRRRRPLSLERLFGLHGDSRSARRLVNSRSGRSALSLKSWPTLDSEGASIACRELIRPGGTERIRAAALEESHWELADELAFAAAWEAECAEIAARIEVETINLATGVLLPVWNRLPDDDVRVWRVCDADGQDFLGRIISPAGFEKLAQSFGVAMNIALSPAELLQAARMSDGVPLSQLPGARLERRYVNDEARLEIRNFPPARLSWLKSLGCFTEIISYRTRLFMPANRAIEILCKIEETEDGSAETA